MIIENLRRFGAKGIEKPAGEQEGVLYFVPRHRRNSLNLGDLGPRASEAWAKYQLLLKAAS